MPPSHAGMVPSALPAFSPPRGVSSCPRRAASCGLTAAHASGANSSPAAVTRISAFIAAPPYLSAFPAVRLASERELDARRNEVAIVEQVVLAGSAVVRVGNVQLPPRARAAREAERGRVPSLHEVAAGSG